ncbi:MAG: non-canonical purine NTP pyrophosphatase [Microbacteriaceae bacterium]|nr:non-canonical purine NTP pyrophosphatase [Microbacteriaceae bacterium]
MSPAPIRLVLATHNAHKVAELTRILGPQLDGFELIGYDGPEPIEDGLTFGENALIKARAAALFTGLPAIADDSGICVDALHGAPGIHSARYSGTRVDADNLQKLLETMASEPNRSAHFECAAALVIPGVIPAETIEAAATASETTEGATATREWAETGVWPGKLRGTASGADGFGYDPIFEPEGYAVSAAELDPAEKNRVSHRAIAFGKLIDVVRASLSL